MKRFTAAAIAIVLAGMSAPAFADSTRTVSGPEGNSSTVTRSGNCVQTGAGLVCGRSVTRTGPEGNTYSRGRDGSVTCENGSCTGTTSVDSYRGATRSRTVTVTGN